MKALDLWIHQNQKKRTEVGFSWFWILLFLYFMCSKWYEDEEIVVEEEEGEVHERRIRRNEEFSVKIWSK